MIAFQILMVLPIPDQIPEAIKETVPADKCCVRRNKLNANARMLQEEF